MASATPSTIATPTPSAVNLRPSAANHKPGATRDNASVTNNRAGATNVKPRAAKPNPLASNNLKPAGAPKPEPGATMQMGPAQLDAVHRKVIQSIDGAGKAMSTARANVETAKSSKEGRNKVVAKASEVVGALLTPGRHVVGLLSGLGALFPPCKQVSSALAALIKHELGRPEKDVRVAIVHFDLARALVHVGSLNRKSRPTKSLGDPLCELMKNFKGLIQEIGQFCEAYYETRAPESSPKHLLHWKSNKDGLNGFAARIAQLKKDLTSLLSQQAVQHPGKHTDALAQIESRLTENRAFYGTITDANEEVAEAFPSKQRGEASVQLDGNGNLLKQLAGVVGEGVTQSITSAIKESTVTTLKQIAKSMSDSNQKTTQRGLKASFSSNLQGTLDKLVSGSPQKVQVDPKSGPRGGQEHVRKQGNNTHVPARQQHSGQQQVKGTGEHTQKQAMSTHVSPRVDHSGHQQMKGTGEHTQKQASNDTRVPVRGQQHSGHQHVKGAGDHTQKQAMSTYVPPRRDHSGDQQMKGTGEHTQKQASNNPRVPVRGQQHSGHQHVKTTGKHTQKQGKRPTRS
ncbi:hypothetical protein DFH94DRAFT_309695 [Russula ochroleuca]|uniref:Uncharacterized protein n=1 Tax=Russula ochroleuca TaxID=152965 RepID=A0A9P5N0L1_9AGAM|nr:hypothetical protein DFH94DRAFT_309695 [Russula ochroleuca]